MAVEWRKNANTSLRHSPEKAEGSAESDGSQWRPRQVIAERPKAKTGLNKHGTWSKP
jgi:hypothetical protein